MSFCLQLRILALVTFGTPSLMAQPNLVFILDEIADSLSDHIVFVEQFVVCCLVVVALSLFVKLDKFLHSQVFICYTRSRFLVNFDIRL